jgi:hypothetical protein
MAERSGETCSSIWKSLLENLTSVIDQIQGMPLLLIVFHLDFEEKILSLL